MHADELSLEGQRPLVGVEEIQGNDSIGYIAVRLASSVVLLNASSLAPVFTYYGDSIPTSIAMHPALPLLAIGDDNGTISTLNLTTQLVEDTTVVGPSPTEVWNLQWSPSGMLIAAQYSYLDGVAVFDRSLMPFVSFPNATYRDRFDYGWALVTSKEALMWGGARLGSSVAFHFLDRSVAPFDSPLNNHTNLDWSLAANGKLVAYDPGSSESPAQLFTSSDFGSNLTLRTGIRFVGQSHVSFAPDGDEFATWGSSQDFTLWKGSFLPFLDVNFSKSVGAAPLTPVSSLVWAGPNALVVWSAETRILYRFVTVRGASVLGLAIAAPLEGQAVNGSFRIWGASYPSGLSGTVVLRIDLGTWIEIEANSSWGISFDSRVLGDGSHLIVAAFSDGANYSEWQTRSFQSRNGIPPGFDPPWVRFKSPFDGEQVAGAKDVVLLVHSPNTANGSVVWVEAALDEGPWRRVPYDGYWQTTWDFAETDAGAHRLHARTNDGIGLSSVFSITVWVVHEPAIGLAPPSVDTPLAGSIVYGPTVFSGHWDSLNSTGGRIEVRFAGGPWIGAHWNDTDSSRWLFQIALGRADTPTWTFCARAANQTAVSPPICVTYRSPPDAIDGDPSVSINEVVIEPTQAGTWRVSFSGAAADDRTVVMVIVQLDGGAWEMANGTSTWQLERGFPGTEGGTHNVSAEAYDGFHYSAPAERGFTLPSPAAPISGGDQLPAAIIIGLLAVPVIILALVLRHRRLRPPAS